MYSPRLQKQQGEVTSTSMYESNIADQFIDRSTRISLLTRFGMYASIVLSVGSGVIIACIGFICFLFTASTENQTWHRIVLAGWVPRSITITALALRVSVTAQATVCTAMLASVFLNTFQTPLPSAAAISLMRFSNNGPRSLLAYLPTPRRPEGFFMRAIVALMAIVTLLLQFTSTALVSDVGTGSITISQQIAKQLYGLNASSLDASQLVNTGFLGVKESLYPAFGEYSEAPEQVDRVRDTGVSIRAFLPIQPGDARSQIRRYNGMATIIDTRVVCMQPTVSNISLTAFFSGGKVSGQIWTEKSTPRFNRSTGVITHTNFSCSFAMPGFWNNFYAGSYQWPMSLCKLNMTDNGIVSQMDPLVLPPAIAYNPGDAYLLANITGAFDSLVQVNNAGGVLPIVELVADNEWLYLGTNTSGVSLGLTICYTNNQVQDRLIDAKRTSVNDTEATSGWNATTEIYETYSIRKQLGAIDTIQSAHDRGIFSLAHQDWQAPPSLNYSGSSGTNWTQVRTLTQPYSVITYAMNGFSDPDGLTMLCGYCQPGGKIYSNRLTSAVFNDIMRDSGNTAVAVQSLLTTVFGLAYYDYAGRFDVGAPAETTSYVSVLKPIRHRFYLAVATLGAIHLILVALVTILFAVAGKNSLLGNAWSAVAQLQSPETERWLPTVSSLKDTEVAKAMKVSGIDKTYVGIVDEGGRLQVMRQS